MLLRADPDGRPHVFEDRWISLESAPEIEDIDLTRQSANEWLVLNKPCTRLDLRLSAVAADENVAEVLDVASGAALLVIERKTWIGAKPITTVRALTTPGYQLF